MSDDVTPRSPRGPLLAEAGRGAVVMQFYLDRSYERSIAVRVVVVRDGEEVIDWRWATGSVLALIRAALRVFEVVAGRPFTIDPPPGGPR